MGETIRKHLEVHNILLVSTCYTSHGGEFHQFVNGEFLVRLMSSTCVLVNSLVPLIQWREMVFMTFDIFSSEELHFL